MSTVGLNQCDVSPCIQVLKDTLATYLTFLHTKFYLLCKFTDICLIWNSNSNMAVPVDQVDPSKMTSSPPPSTSSVSSGSLPPMSPPEVKQRQQGADSICYKTAYKKNVWDSNLILATCLNYSRIALWLLVSVLIGYCDYFGHVWR